MDKRRLYCIGILLVILAVGASARWYWGRDPAKQLREMTPAERVAAIRDTGGNADVDFLLAALKDEDADVRIVAAQHLHRDGWRGAERAAALVAALRDPHTGVRREAAESLCRIGPDASSALCEALKDPDPRVRAGAALALGDVGFGMGDRRPRAKGEEQIIEPILKELLNDDDPEVRKNAAHTLKVLDWDRRSPR
jgi:HEAT repeat protein